MWRCSQPAPCCGELFTHKCFDLVDLALICSTTLLFLYLPFHYWLWSLAHISQSFHKKLNFDAFEWTWTTRMNLVAIMHNDARENFFRCFLCVILQNSLFPSRVVPVGDVQLFRCQADLRVYLLKIFNNMDCSPLVLNGLWFLEIHATICHCCGVIHECVSNVWIKKHEINDLNLISHED